MKHKIERYGHIKTLPRKPFSHSYNKQDIETVKPIVESLTQEKHAAFQSYANLLNTHRQNFNLDGMVVYAPNKK